ncbi:hypothetical protein POX_h09541 [Penicillium oxalicum]|uniref:Uncharacterized protein n=1 Tax=Penicillium oxalicum (strain 114-2 / CGMCC 5302) TaxID=933388 RepID=S7ZLQ0_PENO1|nr:hypothetical protein POX_h09541 [Penicillium oxalicum]EPS31244.1 hypothetical protein PDE_06199 [Penicillium oxalicum 114-2]KAI2785782.1 hypothetical protein POX_h09541 [Penicillium oxalicum]
MAVYVWITVSVRWHHNCRASDRLSMLWMVGIDESQS